MSSVLDLDEILLTIEQFFKVATRLKRELPTGIAIESVPLIELSSLAEDNHVKTREASENTDLDISEFSCLDKVLPGKLKNDASKLTEIN